VRYRGQDIRQEVFAYPGMAMSSYLRQSLNTRIVFFHADV
jgi:hypothetical protein